MVTQIGVVAGIQVLSTVQGGGSSTGSFTVAYLVGDRRRRHRRRHASSVGGRPARLSVAEGA
jgi:hypothetical protein